MRNRNKFIVKEEVAKAQREICEILYNQEHQAVYDYADVVGMANSNCRGCEKETPTIITVENDECALCGGSKEKQNKY